MREIKFRAWNRKGNMSAPFTLHKAANGPRLDDQLNPDRVDIMQFTGLKDKNGKDVYEGDVLQSDQTNVEIEVIWDNHKTGWYPFMHWDTNAVYEVVANKYEGKTR